MEALWRFGLAPHDSKCFGLFYGKPCCGPTAQGSGQAANAIVGHLYLMRTSMCLTRVRGGGGVTASPLPAAQSKRRHAVRPGVSAMRTHISDARQHSDVEHTCNARCQALERLAVGAKQDRTRDR